MSTTDHAFIRAYGQQTAAERAASAPHDRHPLQQPDRMPPGESWRHEATGERIWITRVPDASPVVTHSAVDTPTRQEKVTGVENPHRTWQQTADQHFIRWDPAGDTVMPPHAHFRQGASHASVTPIATPDDKRSETARSHSADAAVTPGGPGLVGDGLQLGTSATLGPSGTAPRRDLMDFQPQWEVDQLQWPAVCDRLQRTSHHRLSEIVTSLMAAPHNRPRIIGITSFGRREGRTTLALALARLACGVNARVALVEGDLEHADLAQQVSIAFDAGWESWDAPTPLGESAVLSIRDQLVLMPVGQQARPVAEPRLVDRAQQMLSILRSHLDLVFVDTGPMYISAHRWFRPAPSVGFDAALVIRDVRHSDPDQVDDVCCRLVSAGVRDAAIIENFQDQG